MSETMISALWITLIGMGLVFIAIILLWGMMDLMMRLTAKKAGEEQMEDAKADCEPTPPEEAFTDLAILRRRAAAAAVAIALSMRPTDATPDSLPGRVTSSWQSVGRAASLNQSSSVYSRKTR